MKFKLLAEHVLPDGRLLEEGTDVGDDTSYPWRNKDGSPQPPSTQMLGMDPEGQKAVEDLHMELYGTKPTDLVDPEVVKVREAEATAQKALDEGSAPVSDRQTLERRMAEAKEKGEAVYDPRVVSSTATAAPTRGGVTRPSPGVASANPPTGQAARVTNPNQEQYPKDSGGSAPKKE